MELQNCIDGEERPSRRAGRFTWRAALPPRDVLAEAPRSGVEEVEVARASIARGARSWWRRPLEDRRRLVERGLARFVSAALEEAPRLAAGLGLDPHELEPELAESGRAGVAAARLGRQAPPGVALVVPDWRTPTGPLLADVARALVEGHVVLLCADEHAPLIPALLVEELLDVGLPTNSLALLHAPTEEALDLAIQSGLERVSIWSEAARIAHLRRVVSGAAVPTQRLRLHRARPDRLPLGADPEDAAEEAVRRAFGRASTLSGVRGGQLSTLYVPAAELSVFTEALVERMLVDRSYLEPLPFLVPGAARRLREAWTLGLDEGATLILGGEVRSRSGERRSAPVLLTNGEARMRSARRVEPEPVLLLCRE